jgi:hypothetical protein
LQGGTPINATSPSGLDPIPEVRKSAVRAELARIVESPAFRGSRRSCKFLEYSVEHVLNGCAPEELKERNIGVEVLQRSPGYDTGEDASVRVTANEVRKRLAQYYQGTDADANPVIALPPGSYAVTFHWAVPLLEPVEAPHAPEPRPQPKTRTVTVVSLALAVILAVSYGAVLWRGQPGARSVESSRPARDLLWPRIFNPGQKTSIVISDAVFREIQQVVGRDLSLGDYLAPDYPKSLIAGVKPELRPTLEFLARQQNTSVGSATLGAKLLAFGKRFGADPVIRYPRHINVREFNTDNFILLGSRLSIPWVEMFESSLNFVLATDPATHRFYLRNRFPQAGELAEYREPESHEVTYADVALVPNLAGTGTVLILDGIDMVAAEAAGQFALDGSLSANLARPAASAGGYLEVLIRVRAVGGTAAQSEVVALRPIGRTLPAR